MQPDSYYALLGVDENSGAEEIGQVFRSLARQYHPDLHPNDSGAEQRFKAINEAYAVLSDPEKRQEYDRQRAARSAAEQQTGISGEPSAYDPGVNVRRSISVGTLGEGGDEAELTQAVQQVANEMAGQIREVMRSLSDELAQLTDELGNQLRRQSPPPRSPRRMPPHPPKRFR